eukprot:1382181-Amorphochlora_amoeboformis.AAC.1
MRDISRKSVSLPHGHVYFQENPILSQLFHIKDIYSQYFLYVSPGTCLKSAMAVGLIALAAVAVISHGTMRPLRRTGVEGLRNDLRRQTRGVLLQPHQISRKNRT